MPVYIRNENKSITIQLAAVKRLLQKCLKHLNFSQAEVSVLITGDETVAQLNQAHRHIARTTDILSFGMRELRHTYEPLPPHPEILGDLVVSLPTVAKQARERKISVQEELHFVLIHGLLHLLGYDHATPAQTLRMNALHQTLAQASREK